MPNYLRTHNCQELRAKNIEETITLSGWVHRRRDHGGLIFIDLRDLYGLTQLVFDPKVNTDTHADAEKLRAEWVISVKGNVIPRKEGMQNSNLDTGEIEINVQSLEILSPAKTPPFSVCDDALDVHEELRLKYRYLDIRRGGIARNLILRHKATMLIRNFLDKSGFFEITTPILCKSTPEGARDYIVPSRIHPGHFYALPQSPQLFKQILMISGMDKYFQIATCFRDEDLRADRQPEFTQIDVELSFSNSDILFSLVESLFKDMFKTLLGVDIKTPFRHLTHKECLEVYGTDKPDLRFAMPLARLDDIAIKSTFSVFLDQIKTGGCIKGICVKGGQDVSRKGINEYTNFVGQFGITGLAWMKMQNGTLTSSIVKFFNEETQKLLINRLNIEDNDLILMAADQEDRVNQAMDHLRRKIAKARSLISPNHYELLWVTDFPLFTWDKESNRLHSEHHPFTSIHPEDCELLDSDPLKARASSYDLVLDGYEIASGSQRIHDNKLQKKIFSLLQLSDQEIESKFGFFVDSLQYGTPPHLGIAIGLDRLLMIFSNTENIRDVIAFPKTQKAGDLMMEAPSSIQEQQLAELKISLEE